MTNKKDAKNVNSADSAESILAISTKEKLFSKYKMNRKTFEKIEYYLDVEKLDNSETFLFSENDFKTEYFFLFEVQQLLQVLVEATHEKGFFSETREKEKIQIKKSSVIKEENFRKLLNFTQH